MGDIVYFLSKRPFRQWMIKKKKRNHKKIPYVSETKHISTAGWMPWLEREMELRTLLLETKRVNLCKQGFCNLFVRSLPAWCIFFSFFRFICITLSLFFWNRSQLTIWALATSLSFIITLTSSPISSENLIPL